MKNILKKVKIDCTTYLLIILALFAGYIKNISLILLIVLIHEIGHVFFFILFKIKIQKITIFPFGGVTYVNKKLHERIYKDVLISLGGIFFQVILGVFFLILYNFDFIVSSTYSLFTLYNIRIIIFNILPIIPLDGSKFIFAILSKYLAYRDSYIIMIVLGIISLFLFIGFNFVYKVNDLILYVFLIFKLYEVIKESKYVINKFYLERVLYNHYYNEIISDYLDIKKIRIDKYYFFDIGGKYLNEKDYLRLYYFK